MRQGPEILRIPRKITRRVLPEKPCNPVFPCKPAKPVLMFLSILRRCRRWESCSMQKTSKAVPPTWVMINRERIGRFKYAYLNLKNL